MGLRLALGGAEAVGERDRDGAAAVSGRDLGRVAAATLGELLEEAWVLRLLQAERVVSRRVGRPALRSAACLG